MVEEARRVAVELELLGTHLGVDRCVRLDERHERVVIPGVAVALTALLELHEWERNDLDVTCRDALLALG
jgi:hypothetical protein